MERRTFVKGAFGLVVVAAGVGLGLAGAQGDDADTGVGTILFETPEAALLESAKGPAMLAGIRLVEHEGSSELSGYFEGVELFSVNPIGAALIGLADGSRTIDELAAQAADLMGRPVEAVDVASFFVTLGQAGYLQNTVLVNLYEIPA